MIWFIISLLIFLFLIGVVIYKVLLKEIIRVIIQTNDFIETCQTKLSK